MIGKTVSHYKILEKLGEGGMGVVYKAEDTKLKRRVALKFLPHELTEDQEARQRFIHEAQTASALDHPNICNIHEIDEEKEGDLFICMTLYDGHTLKKRIQSGPIPIHEIINIAIQIAQGLNRAHKAEIIHRDLKPANIFLTHHGEVKIIDFGLAKLSGQTDITKTGSPMGTVWYMSPEQARGEKLDAGTDIWSFGVILYELLSGKPPFKAEYDQAVIYSILNENPVPLKELCPDVPIELIDIVNQCLIKNRKNRFNSIRDFLEILQQIRQEITPSDQVYQIPSVGKKPRKLKKYAIPISVILIICIIYSAWHLLFALPEDKHLIVLPFNNIRGENEGAIFCDGLLETITSRLAQLKQYNESLEVIPSNIVNRYRINNAEKAFERLGATLAITGSIDKRKDYTQFTLNLIDTRSLRLIDSHDFKMDIIKPDFQVEEKLFSEIVDMLELNLNEPHRAEFFSVGTQRQSAFDFYIRGRGYLEKYEDINNIDTAIRLFKKALDVDSTFTLAYTGIGDAYWWKYTKTKDTIYVAPAFAACQQAMELNSHYAETYVTYGTIHNGIGEHDEAIEKFKKAVTLDNANATAFWKLGQAYWAIGDTVKALETYKKAIQERPGYWQGYSHLGTFYLRTGKYNKAVETYQKIVDILPNSDLGYSYLAATYFYMERLTDAIQMSKRALDNNPSYRTRHNLASFYYYAGDYYRATKIYHQVLQYNNKDYRIWGSLATAYYFITQLDSARICYLKAVELAEGQLQINPIDQVLLACLAGYYARLEENEKAYNLLEKVTKLNPTNLDVIFDIGDVYEQLGEREMALEWMEKAIMNNYKLARFNNNPGLRDLIADERFKKLIEKYTH
jgi:serine/threonine-protein kinase